jgi:hypothetical protein
MHRQNSVVIAFYVACLLFIITTDASTCNHVLESVTKMYRVKRDSRNQIKTILESMATMPVETPSDKVYHVKADCISDVRVVSIVFDDEHPSYVHATDFHAAGLEYEKSKHPMDLSGTYTIHKLTSLYSKLITI